MDNCKTMRIIGDYDIVVDDPEKHVPYAMFCSTIDALEFMKKLKNRYPYNSSTNPCSWKVIKLSDWQKLYKGE